MELITSLENKKIKTYAKLLNKKYRDETNHYLVEGEHLVEEAYQTGNLLEVITTPEYSKKYNVPTTFVTYDIIKKLSKGVNPQLVIGVVKKKQEAPITGNVLILDNISDPGNLGTIIRSSVAFNIDTIVLSLDTVDLYNDKVLRATEGMLYKVNIVKKDIKEVINMLHKDNYSILGTNVNGGTNIKDITHTQKIAIIVGNEGQGVKKEILDICDDYIYIPMNKNCESLNVGVATSIILYELFK